MERNSAKTKIALIFALLLVLVTAWRTGRDSTNAVGGIPRHEVITGTASFYGRGFEGQRTASGEIFRSREMTAAHRTLPLGSRVRVTNLENNRQVVVEITDRGPYVRNRVIDLSAGAARRIAMQRDGLTKVKIEVLERPE